MKSSENRLPSRVFSGFWVGFVAMALLLHAEEGNAQAGDEWTEWVHQWGQLSITVRTNAGVYSPALQALSKGSHKTQKAIEPDALMSLTRTFFVMTSASRVDHTFEFIEPLAKKWGPGHGLPILAAIALENLQRPIPTLFGGSVSAITEQMKPVAAGGLDPQRPGRLRIVVHGHQSSFRRAAEQAAHASVKAYYDANRNEVGLLLDMAAFRHFYANLDSLPDRHPETLSAFIAFAMDAFNEDSSHELAHVYQQQVQRSAYIIPAIREGEAEVQGLVRRRDGLMFNFLYNTPDAWVRGKFDGEVLKNRVTTLQASGRPMHPREVERLADLKRLRQAGRALRVGDLLAMDAQAFFAGTVTDIESRYAQAWALCLQAIREKDFAQGLGSAIEARLAHAPRAELEEQLNQQHLRFIDDPYQMVVTKETAWADAERFYRIDPVFAGVFYTWIHQIDPSDMKALIYLGDSLYKGRNLHAAMRYYEAAQRLDPRSALPLIRVGDVLSYVGDREGALRTWRAAGSSDGEGPEEVSYRRLAAQRPSLPAEGMAGKGESQSTQALSAALALALDPVQQWLSFAPYPGARMLCSQRVIGTKGEILDWRSFATADDMEKVAAFYVSQGLRDPDRSGGEVLYRRGSEGVLSLRPAAPSKPPTCDQAPRANEKTVVFISTMKR